MPNSVFVKLMEIEEVPESPGVYRFFDDNNQLIYIGKSKNLRQRMLQYKTLSRKKKHRKGRRIVEETCRISFELCGSEGEALLLENEHIQKHKPKFNTAGAYYFMYPVIAAKFSDRRLQLVRTSSPDAYETFELYGAFRDRNLVSLAFDSLDQLLGIFAHKEPASRTIDIPKAPYSKRMAFRQVPVEFWSHFTNFMSGENCEVLSYLFNLLLESPVARAKAKEIESALKILRQFYIGEAQKLHDVLEQSGLNTNYVDQSERDRLFIRSDFGESSL